MGTYQQEKWKAGRGRGWPYRTCVGCGNWKYHASCKPGEVCSKCGTPWPSRGSQWGARQGSTIGFYIKTVLEQAKALGKTAELKALDGAGPEPARA